MEQKIITAKDNYIEFDQWLQETGCKKILMVCGKSIFYMNSFHKHLTELEKHGVETVYFQDFMPNPVYESVLKGVSLFREANCDGVMAVGGGSAIDVAKCIKLYANLPGDGKDGAWLQEEIITNDIPFLVMPTTAGSGSEATRYAVVYFDGRKQSITSENCIPDTVLLDPGCLKALPIYQKKSTMMDALCHAIESFWSVNSTDQSEEYSRKAIHGVLDHMDGYLANTEKGNTGMLLAAHIAGKAINITQTTAGHAMCYKITGLFGCAHGHAAILCDRVLFPWMVENTGKCIDPRGEEHLIEALNGIGVAMGCKDARSGAAKLTELYERLKLEIPMATEEQYKELKASVNPIRIKNHPIRLTIDTIDALYHEILR